MIKAGASRKEKVVGFHKVWQKDRDMERHTMGRIHLRKQQLWQGR